MQLPVAGAPLTPFTGLFIVPPRSPCSAFCHLGIQDIPHLPPPAPGQPASLWTLRGIRRGTPPSPPSEQVSWAAHESEGVAAQLGSSPEIDPSPPPLPPPGICSGEKQASQSGCLTGRRREVAPSPTRRLDPARVQLRSVQTLPGPDQRCSEGSRPLGGAGGPRWGLACGWWGGRATAAALLKGDSARPFPARRALRWDLPEIWGSRGAGWALPEEAGAASVHRPGHTPFCRSQQGEKRGHPPSCSPASSFCPTFPTCFLNSELWDGGRSRPSVHLTIRLCVHPPLYSSTTGCPQAVNPLHTGNRGVRDSPSPWGGADH